MNSIWLSLLWKEWCEQRWKLAALTGILVGVPALTVVAMYWDGEAGESDIPDIVLGIATSVLYIYALLAGMFVGMSVAAGENSRRTSHFLSSLPISSWQTALIKLLIAMFVVSFPVFIMLSLVWMSLSFLPAEPGQVQMAIRQNSLGFRLAWGIETWLIARAVGGVLGVVSVLLWTVAGGVNRADEVRAGAVAFLVGAVAWMFFAGLAAISQGYEIETMKKLGLIVLPALPGGAGLVNSHIVRSAEDVGLSRAALILAAMIGHSFLLVWYLKKFGRMVTHPAHNKVDDWKLLPTMRAAKMPLRTPIDAIIWKQVRETAPLSLIAVVGIVTLVPLYYWWDRLGGGTNTFGDMLGATTAAVAALVALFTGIGVLYEDYAKGVENFWRSRPLNAHVWFWIKFFTGLSILIISFVPLAIFSYWLASLRDPPIEVGWFALLFYLLLYALALAAYTLVRQPIYAVVLAIASLFCGWLVLLWMFSNGPPQWLSSFLGYSTVLILSTMTVTILAWQAVVRDWGWKQSR